VASHYGKGGVVLVDPDECIGCKACITSCPYDARFVHPDGYVDKCTFCIHRVEQGDDPACVSVCPTHAMVFGDMDDSNSEIAKLVATRKWKTLIPEAGTKPNIYYLT
jgi:Fe-S-cluster-containing dehydrogenase component